MANYKPVIIRPSSREAWLEKRSQGIGASEVGAILGLSHFDTPYSIWRRKVGIDGPVPENMAMIMGHLLEDAVAQRFALETGFTIIKASAADIIYCDPDKAFMRVTPDRIAKTPDGKALVECKTTARKISENSIPYSWLCQVQYQMRVTGIHTCYLAWLISGRDFGYVKIDYDEVMAKYIEDNVTEFWFTNVLGNVEPESVSLEDVMTKFPVSSTDKSTTADQQALMELREVARLNRQIKDLEGKRDEKLESIKLLMADSEILVTEQGELLATWKTGKARTTLDTKKLMADHPDIYAKYVKEGKPSRTFLLKVDDE